MIPTGKDTQNWLLELYKQGPKTNEEIFEMAILKFGLNTEQANFRSKNRREKQFTNDILAARDALKRKGLVISISRKLWVSKDPDTDNQLKAFLADKPYEQIKEFIEQPAKIQKERLQKYVDRNQKIKKEVKIRDNYTCQICNQIGFEQKNGELYIEVDHIIPFHLDPNINDAIDNLQCLCANCHRVKTYASTKTINELRLKKKDFYQYD
jgi:predicted HNH restriction endonuclease